MRYWYVVHLSEKNLSLVARTFLEFLLSHTEEEIQQASWLLRKGENGLIKVSGLGVMRNSVVPTN